LFIQSRSHSGDPSFSLRRFTCNDSIFHCFDFRFNRLSDVSFLPLSFRNTYNPELTNMVMQLLDKNTARRPSARAVVGLAPSTKNERSNYTKKPFEFPLKNVLNVSNYRSDSFKTREHFLPSKHMQVFRGEEAYSCILRRQHHVVFPLCCSSVMMHPPPFAELARQKCFASCCSKNDSVLSFLEFCKYNSFNPLITPIHYSVPLDMKKQPLPLPVSSSSAYIPS
jgi:hypothetical protein